MCDIQAHSPAVGVKVITSEVQSCKQTIADLSCSFLMHLHICLFSATARGKLPDDVLIARQITDFPKTSQARTGS